MLLLAMIMMFGLGAMPLASGMADDEPDANNRAAYSAIPANTTAQHGPTTQRAAATATTTTGGTKTTTRPSSRTKMADELRSRWVATVAMMAAADEAEDRGGLAEAAAMHTAVVSELDGIQKTCH